MLFTAILLVHGVPLDELLRYMLYLLGVILMPGRWLWLRLRPESPASASSRLEAWVCGAALGYVLELVSYVPARWMGYPRAYLLVPAAIMLWAVTEWLVQRGWHRWRERWYDEPVVASGASWGTAAVVSYLAVWLSVKIFSTHPLRSTSVVDPDEMFQLALVGELRHHFPAVYPYVEYPGYLTYQWFVHAHFAAATWATGISSETLYRRTEPLVLSTLAVLGAGVIAATLARRLWAVPTAAGLLVLVGSFDVTGTVVGEAAPEERFLLPLILVHSPTQTFGYVLAIPVAVISLWLVHGEKKVSLRNWALLAVMALAVSGAKVTFLPLFVCGFICVMAVDLLRRRRPAQESLLAVGLLGSAIVLSATALYGGDSQSLGFLPLMTTSVIMTQLGMAAEGLLPQLIVTASLLSMWLLPGVGVLVLLRRPSYRWDPRLWWLLGAVASGYGAQFLLGHGGNSQAYFGRSAALYLAAAAAWGLVVLHERASTKSILSHGVLASVAGLVLLLVRGITESWRTPVPSDEGMVDSPALRSWINLPVILMIVAVAFLVRLVVRDLTSGRTVIGAGSIVILLTGLGLARTFAFVLGHQDLPTPPPASKVFGRDGRAAAEWLRENSDPDERVVTNAHCGPGNDGVGGKCDSRHFWMSALSERRFVLEGWAYTAKSGDWFQEFWGDRRFLEENDALFTEPSEQRLRDFLSRHPASWLLLDRRQAVDLSRLRNTTALEERFVAGHYSIWRVTSKSASP